MFIKLESKKNNRSNVLVSNNYVEISKFLEIFLFKLKLHLKINFFLGYCSSYIVNLYHSNEKIYKLLALTTAIT